MFYWKLLPNQTYHIKKWANNNGSTWDKINITVMTDDGIYYSLQFIEQIHTRYAKNSTWHIMDAWSMFSE